MAGMEPQTCGPRTGAAAHPQANGSACCDGAVGWFCHGIATGQLVAGKGRRSGCDLAVGPGAAMHDTPLDRMTLQWCRRPSGRRQLLPSAWNASISPPCNGAVSLQTADMRCSARRTGSARPSCDRVVGLQTAERAGRFRHGLPRQQAAMELSACQLRTVDVVDSSKHRPGAAMVPTACGPRTAVQA